MAKFRKKPVIIEAVQWDGENFSEIEAFTTNVSVVGNKRLVIPTLEGIMEASEGDWIIKGVAGEFYPCKPDIFEQTYEPITDTITLTGTTSVATNNKH